MGAATRTVRRLRLRAPSEASVHRTARVLEDALRTASLPDSGGRMLFVRRLALGRLPAHAEPISIALALEQAVARLGVEWRHGDEATASASPAVWFRDPLEAHVALARRILAGTPPGAWYWPLAVPAWNRGLARGEAVRTIAFSLAARVEAPVALPRWVAALVEAGYGPALATVLRAEDAEPLARAAGVRLGRVGETGRALRDDAPASGEPPPLTRPTALHAEAGVVHRLIASMLRTGDYGRPHSHASASPEERGEPRDTAFEGHRLAHDLPAGPTPPRSAAAPPDRQRPGGRPARLPGGSGPAAPRSTGRAAEEATAGCAGEAPDVGASDKARVAPVASRGPERAWPQPSPTLAGGLPFLLNALDRIGYGAWLAGHPEWGSQRVAGGVLRRVLERLDVPHEDPAWAVVVGPAAMGAAPHRFVAPSRWREGLLTGLGPLLHSAAGRARRLRDPSGRLLLGAWSGACPRSLVRDLRGTAPLSRPPGELTDEVVGAWDVALRRWLRRFARVSISDAVLRPAAITVTPTHLDVHFGLGAAEARIRRAGLDFDPGWVRWFGKVVAFHYHPGLFP